MDSVCGRTIKHIIGVKWTTCNWSAGLVTGIFDFTFRQRKMKFKYVIKNMFMKSNVDNGWVRVLENMSLADKSNILEDVVFFNFRGIKNTMFLEGLVRSRGVHNNIYDELSDCFLDAVPGK